MERKQLDISNLKFSDTGDGEAEGVFNKMFIVDDGADITIGLSQPEHFLTRGFIADTHGLANGQGVYSTASEVGIPKSLEIRHGDEIYGGFEFHSTQYAQDCRKVMSKRTGNGLVAPYSIGYDLAKPPIYINADEYETKLKLYIPAAYLERCIQGAKQFRRVRLIDVILNEVSTVPIPMNTESQATSVKSRGTLAVKGAAGETWLSPKILDYTTINALDDLWCACLWCCYDVRWGDSDDPAADYVEILNEFYDLASKLIPAIMGIAGTDAEGMKSQMIALFGDPIVKEFKNNNMKDGIDRSFKSDLKDSIAILSFVAERGRQIAAKNAGKKNAPFDNASNTEAFKSLYSTVLDVEIAMAGILPELKAGAALSAASKKVINDHADEVIAKCSDIKSWAGGDTTDEDEKTTAEETDTKTPDLDIEGKIRDIDLEITNRTIAQRK